MSLQVWLPLNGSLMNQGLSNLAFSIVNTTNTTSTNDGKIAAQSYSNNSRTGGGIISNSQLNVNKTISIFAWIKYTSRHSNPMGIGGMHTISGSGYSAGTGMGMQIIQNPSNTSQNVLAVSTGNGSGRTWNTYYSKTPLAANTWYHVGFTYDGTNIKFYINGVWDEKVITYSDQRNIADYVHVFAWSQDGNGTKPNTYSGDYKFNGCINDFRIYDHCLSPREVKLLAQGLVAHYKLDDPNIESTTNILNGVWQHTNFSQAPLGTYSLFSNQLGSGGSIEVRQFNNRQCLYIKGGSGGNDRCYRSIAVSGDKAYTFSLDLYSASTTNVYIKCEATGGDYGTSWPTVGSANYTKPNQWQRLSFTMNLNTNPTLYFFIQTPNNNVIYVDNIQLEEKDHPTPYTPSSREGKVAYNCSGYGNHGTASASFGTSIDSPRYSHSTVFKDNKYINCGRGAMVTDEITVSCWAYADDWTKFTGQFISCTDSGGWGLGYGANTDGHGFEVFCNGSYYGINLNYNNLSAGWHHFVATYNKNSLAGYIDGAPKVSKSGLPGKLTYHASNNMLIGAEPSGTTASGSYFTGQLSDLRIYATALSAAAIKELYQSSISLLDNGILQCSEIVENNTNLKYNQNGIVQANQLNEIGYVDKMKIKTLSDGSAWARIHWLDVTSTQTYFTTAEVQECTTANNRFSLMKYVEYFKKNDGYYEFMLTHPKLSTTAYNRWKQTSSPNSSTVSGFSTIGTQAWSEANHGIRKHGGDCIYNCDEGGTWYAPIGQTQGWGGGIPAANQNDIPTTEIELWVRIDNLPKLKKLSMFNKALQAHQIYEL